MLTRAIHSELSSGLQEHGYDVEAFDPKNTDVLDIWHSDRSLGFIEVTVCEARPGYVILCPVDYDNPDQGLIELMNGDVGPLVEQLNAFYAKAA